MTGLDHFKSSSAVRTALFGSCRGLHGLVRVQWWIDVAILLQELSVAVEVKWYRITFVGPSSSSSVSFSSCLTTITSNALLSATLLCILKIRVFGSCYHHSRNSPVTTPPRPAPATTTAIGNSIITGSHLKKSCRCLTPTIASW